MWLLSASNINARRCVNWPSILSGKRNRNDFFKNSIRFAGFSLSLTGVAASGRCCWTRKWRLIPRATLPLRLFPVSDLFFILLANLSRIWFSNRTNKPVLFWRTAAENGSPQMIAPKSRHQNSSGPHVRIIAKIFCYIPNIFFYRNSWWIIIIITIINFDWLLLLNTQEFVRSPKRQSEWCDGIPKDEHIRS